MAGGDDDDCNAGSLGAARHGVLIASASITLIYVALSLLMYGCMCTFRLKWHQMKRVLHRRERLSAIAFLVMLTITQATTINLSAYVSNEFIARRVSDTALFAWITLCGLAVMTAIVAWISRTYARIQAYLGLVLATCGTLVLAADAVASGKVSALDPLAGTTCLVGLAAVFYAIPMAFHLTTMMTGARDLDTVPYSPSGTLRYTHRADSTDQDGILLSPHEEGEEDVDHGGGGNQGTVYDKQDGDGRATEMEDVNLGDDGDRRD